MKYFKDLVTGGVVKADVKPAGLWREATEREYFTYRANLSRMMANLEKAVTYKTRLLGA